MVESAKNNDGATCVSKKGKTSYVNCVKEINTNKEQAKAPDSQCQIKEIVLHEQMDLKLFQVWRQMCSLYPISALGQELNQPPVFACQQRLDLGP